MGRAATARVVIIGGVLVALFVAAWPLSGLAHQNLNASSGSVPVWLTAPFALVGAVLAWRKPANPLGWLMLGGAFFAELSEDASYYAVADYGLRHGDLPLGGAALIAQPGWAPSIVLLGLLVLVFPALEWIRAETCCCSAVMTPPPGGGTWSRRCSSRCWWPAGWRR